MEPNALNPAERKGAALRKSLKRLLVRAVGVPLRALSRLAGERRSRPRTFWLSALAVVALVAAAVVVLIVLPRARTDAPTEAPAVQTVPVVRQDLSVSIPAVGTVVFSRVTELSFDQSGLLVELVVEEGDRVPAGQVLARLDDRDLRSAVEDARSSLRRAEIELSQLFVAPDSAEVERTQLDLREAQASLDDLTAGPSDQELAGARAAVATAEVSVARAAEDLRELTADPSAEELADAQGAVESARATLVSTQDKLEDLLDGYSDSELADASNSLASANASLSASQDALADLRAGPSAKDIEAARDEVAAAREALDKARRDLTDAEQNHPAALADARASAATASATLQARSQDLDELRGKPSPEDIAKAERDRDIARLNHHEIFSSSTSTEVEKQVSALQLAQAEQTYQEALQPASPRDIAAAEATLAAAQATSDAADARLTELQAGPDLAALQEAVSSAERGLAAAQRSLADLEAGPDPADISVKEQDVAAARQSVNVAWIRLQEVRAGASEAELTQEEANLEAARQSLQAAVARLESLRADPDQNEIAIAQTDLVSAQASLAEARARLADLERGPAELELMQADIAVRRAELGLEELAEPPDPLDVEQKRLAVADARRKLAVEEDALAEAVLLAPFDGLVVETHVMVGERASDTVVTLVALDSLRVETEIDESDIGRVAVGQPVTITFPSLDDAEYQGVVVTRGVRGESNQGLVTFPVDIEVRAPDARLLAGLTAYASIHVGQARNALVVPRSAVIETPFGGMVAVMEAEGVAPRRVSTGLSDEFFVEVTQGLEEGEQVVVDAGFGADPNQAGPPRGFGGPGLGGLRRVSGGGAGRAPIGGAP